jgi:uncharacterized protein (TIGR03437 family)
LKRTFLTIALFALAMGIAAADTINTTLTVSGSGSVGSTVNATGTGSLSNVTGASNGTFTATLSFTSLDQSMKNFLAPFSINFSNGIVNGQLSIPVTILTTSSGSVTGSATITGGTGAYAGWTGTFATLTGTGGLSGTSLSLNFSGAGTVNTSGGGSTTATPIITTVASAADYSTSIAQGSLFIVKGSNLSGNGLVQTSFPLPPNSGGSTITFTPLQGGTGTQAFIIYTYNQSGTNQIAAVLPSTIATGTYNVTATYNNVTSAPFVATVVQRHPALFSQDSSGTGLAVVQNFISATQYDINRFTTGSVSGVTISPAHPGQAIIAWGTGLGPITSGDNAAAPGGDLGLTVQVTVGGTNITPAYAGRAPGLASVDQIVFTLPSNITTGCTVPLKVSVNGTTSASTFISIAPAGATACVSPNFTTAQLQNFDNGATITTGGFSMYQITETVPSLGTIKADQIGGGFTTYSGFQLAAIPPQTTSSTTSGSCTIIQVQGTSSQLVSGSGTGLDAGKVTLTGPSGSNLTNQQLSETSNTYFYQIGEEGVPAGTPGINNGKIVAGSYTLSGAGGKDVGSFNATITLGTPLTVTGGLPATVTRSAGLPLAWTGGNSGDLVEIIGYSGSTTGTGATAITNATEFVCLTTAGAGGFTVSPTILNQLPAASSGGTGSTFLEVYSGPNPTTFSAPLTAGGSINNATFGAFIGIANNPTYQ